MNEKKLLNILFWIGVTLLLGGILDPLEGSVVVILGSVAVVLALYLKKEILWRKLFFASLLLTLGIGMMFLLSSLGGIGGKSPYSIWLGLLILPYPVGWIVSVVLLIRRALKK